MAARADGTALPLPFRSILVPTALWSVVAAAMLLLRRRAKEPSVPPMSDEWLRSHAGDRRWYS